MTTDLLRAQKAFIQGQKFARRQSDLDAIMLMRVNPYHHPALREVFERGYRAGDDPREMENAMQAYNDGIGKLTNPQLVEENGALVLIAPDKPTARRIERDMRAQGIDCRAKCGAVGWRVTFRGIGRDEAQTWVDKWRWVWGA